VTTSRSQALPGNGRDGYTCWKPSVPRLHLRTRIEIGKMARISQFNTSTIAIINFMDSIPICRVVRILYNIDDFNLNA
jgi:hypothetical protein